MRDILIAAAALLTGPVLARGMTLRVPSEYTTIQAGIDAAAAGDTVLVAPGSYADYETRSIASGLWTSCIFLKGGVVVRSEGGSGVTTIHMPIAPAHPSVIYGEYQASSGTVLEGFAITSVPLFEAAAWIIGCGEVTFRDCEFRDLVGYVTNAGLNVNNGDVVVGGCRFIRCHTTGGGAGIYHNDGRIEIRDSYFEDCDIRAVRVEPDDTGSEAVVEDCTFVNCGGGAMSLQARPGGTAVRRCHFIGNSNSINSGGGLAVAGSGLKVVEDCVFLFNANTAPNGLGGALWAGGALATVRRCSFVGNHQQVPDVGGAAVAFLFAASSGSRLENNIICGSTGSPAVSGWSGAALASSCNVFWANEVGIAGENYTPGPTDREVDPLFCDEVAGDYTLQVGSPCLPSGSLGCGQIGVFGEGCGSVGVDAESWARIKAAYREGGRP